MFAFYVTKFKKGQIHAIKYFTQTHTHTHTHIRSKIYRFEPAGRKRKKTAVKEF